MSTPRRNDQVIADRLTRDRLRSYLASTPTLSAAIDLYDWNVSIAGALHEDLGRVEVVLRNAMDFALTQHAARTDGVSLGSIVRHCFRGGMVNEHSTTSPARSGAPLRACRTHHQDRSSPS